MATCKDCLHFRVCKAIADTGKFTLDIDRADQSKRCPNFVGKMGWISISDRLPEINQKVLIYTKTEIITCGWYTEAHGLAYNKGFETESGFMWMATASYWMPLPEPPEVDHDPN